MALIKCPECGKSVSNTADSCPNCGYNLRKYAKSTRIKNELKPLRIVVGILSIVLMAAIYISAFQHGIGNILKEGSAVNGEIIFIISTLMGISGLAVIMTLNSKKYYYIYAEGVVYTVCLLIYMINSKPKFNLFSPWPLAICFSMIVCGISVNSIKANNKNNSQD